MSYTFYGRDPSDWYEADPQKGHPFSVALERVPVGSDWAAVAAFVRYANDKCNIGINRLAFSGRLMRLYFDYTYTEATGREFLAIAEEAFDVLHGRMPITDVVFHGVKGDEVEFPKALPGPAFAPEYGPVRPVDDTAQWKVSEELASM